MTEWVIVNEVECVAYGPFDDVKVASRIAEQVGREDATSPLLVCDVRPWREEWTETIAERIRNTRRPRYAAVSEEELAQERAALTPAQRAELDDLTSA